MTRRCYANSLGGCDGLSDEHVVTRGLFGDAMVGTQGMPFPPEKPIHIDRIVAKILCRKHNADLSPLDAEIIKLGEAALSVKSGGRSATVQVNGWLIERWLLKCAIGSAASGWFGPKVYPKPGMVRGLFGLDPLPPEVSMFGVADVARMSTRSDGVSTTMFWESGDEGRMGWLISVHGLPLFLSIYLTDPQNTLRNGKPLDGLVLSAAACYHHPPFITMEAPLTPATMIATFDWRL